MPLNEDRDAIIEVLQFTEKLFDLLIPRLGQSDLQLFQDAGMRPGQFYMSKFPCSEVSLLKATPFGQPSKE
jgi:hypothetical protein